MKFHFAKVQDLAGFAVENANGGEIVKVLTRALLTSNESDFYQYSELFSNTFLDKYKVLTNNVYQFLVIIHQDLSADIYVNDFGILVEIRAKVDIEEGGVVTQGDIADIRKVQFTNIQIIDTDKIIYCFKVGWRFGLFFDLTPRSQPVGAAQPIATEKLDIEQMQLSIGELWRYLSFYHIYKILESGAQFNNMMKDGWFPFVEILASEYKELGAVYQNKFNFENRIKVLVDSFDNERIKRMMGKWWKNQTFSDKKPLIEAGINAYLQNNQDGFVNCIKNLWTEIEGILRKLYYSDTGKGNDVKSVDLIDYIIEKARIKSGSNYSLLLPLPFLEYLRSVVFTNFNVEANNVEMSRNTSSHGVANVSQYTKERALQLILILDQIFFCS